MLFKHQTLKKIKSGSVSVAFRRWHRPTVKAGGTLLTAIGQLAIHDVSVVTIDSIGPEDALAAGYEDLASLRGELLRRTDGDIYRIRVSYAGPDPRNALRAAIPNESEMDDLLQRLNRMDARSSHGPWTLRTLELIAEQPEVRAADLAANMDLNKDSFKANVRKLKRLGLTESLDVGYRLSARGETVHAKLSHR